MSASRSRPSRQHLPRQRQHAPDVVARGQFGHHAAVVGVHRRPGCAAPGEQRGAPSRARARPAPRRSRRRTTRCRGPSSTAVSRRAGSGRHERLQESTRTPSSGVCLSPQQGGSPGLRPLVRKAGGSFLGAPRTASVTLARVVDRVLRDLDRHVLLRTGSPGTTGATCGSRPQARSSRSSSLSSISPSDSKPSRTTTWQVVQAHLISQACSISMSFSSSASQIEVPARRLDACAERAVLGVRQDGDDGHGGVSDFVDVAAGQRLADAAVHAFGGEGLGAVGQRLDGGVDRAVVGAGGERLQLGSSARRSRRARRGSAGRRRRPAPTRVASSMRSASTRDSRSARAAHVGVGAAEALLQHARDLVVGQAVARLDGRSRPRRPRSARAPSRCSRPSASTWKLTRMRAAPATIGGMPRSSKRASERQSADQLALALHHVHAPSPSGRP